MILAGWALYGHTRHISFFGRLQTHPISPSHPMPMPSHPMPMPCHAMPCHAMQRAHDRTIPLLSVPLLRRSVQLIDQMDALRPRLIRFVCVRGERARNHGCISLMRKNRFATYCSLVYRVIEWRVFVCIYGHEGESTVEQNRLYPVSLFRRRFHEYHCIRTVDNRVMPSVSLRLAG
jgi:hypothetical protein